ncbi:MAG: hypothetical protein JSS02_35730 [Planctomycetes bacterium]|nr:hypothetical protein [Planctomycetota bacterium]
MFGDAPGLVALPCVSAKAKTTEGLLDSGNFEFWNSLEEPREIEGFAGRLDAGREADQTTGDLRSDGRRGRETLAEQESEMFGDAVGQVTLRCVSAKAKTTEGWRARRKNFHL